MATPEAIDDVLAELGIRIRRALVAADLPDVDPGFERPRQPEHGDWASTVAMRLAKPARRAPRDIAAAIVDHLDLPDGVASVDIAGPGFLNFRFSPAYYGALIRRVVADRAAFGRRRRDDGEVVDVEFVSANPTGPLHAGAGRWAATGDAIAALIAADGDTVVREYYVNDAGEQIRRFGESVVLVARGQPLGDDHYRGDYVHDIAAAIRAEHGEAAFSPEAVTDVDRDEVDHGAAGAAHLGDGDGPPDDGESSTVAVDDRVEPGLAAHVGHLAVERMRSHIEASLHALGVDFDVWFSERTLHEGGAIDDTVTQLVDAGRTYTADGARFLRTTEFGDDKDRVLVRSDGRPTYFAADCAYMRDKWSRSDRLFYLLGADHHGYVGRLRAAARCLDIPVDRMEIRIGQLVTLLRDGEPVKMSKRAGEFVTLDEVVAEVGADVARYHFLRSSLDTMVDFDLATVARQSMDNPVYYVQYAHARIASLVRTADERGFDHSEVGDVDVTLLTHTSEQELLKALAQLPEVVSEAAELRATQRLARYAEELAATFHRFYTESRVLVDDVAVARARYWLAVAARQVLANTLGLLRVAAPDRM
jgi:arginyl-tRNA synthetase